MPSRSVEERLERVANKLGVTPQTLIGIFRIRSDAEANKIIKVLNYFEDAFTDMLRRGVDIIPLLEELSDRTDYSLTPEEIATEWDEVIRLYAPIGVKYEIPTEAVYVTRPQPRPTHGLTCPKGEEAIKLYCIWEGIKAYEEGTPPITITCLADYIDRNFEYLHPNIRKPAKYTNKFKVYINNFITIYKSKEAAVYNLLKEIRKNADELNYIAYCPQTQQYFKVRAGMTRKGYKETLDGVITKTQLLRTLRNLVKMERREHVPAEEAIPTPTTQYHRIMKTRVAPTYTRRIPYGATALPTPQYGIYPPRKILQELGGRCPICGNTNLILGSNMTVEGEMLTAFCPRCMTTFWYIPQVGKKGFAPPEPIDKVWRAEWLSNENKLIESGWKKGPYKPTSYYSGEEEQ